MILNDLVLFIFHEMLITYFVIVAEYHDLRKRIVTSFSNLCSQNFSYQIYD